VRFVPKRLLFRGIEVGGTDDEEAELAAASRARGALRGKTEPKAPLLGVATQVFAKGENTHALRLVCKHPDLRAG